MAIGGIFTLLDDVAIFADDVAAMAKVSAKKTAAILGDDLAVNAEKSAKFANSRELPVLLKITLGALLNKIIILPFLFLLSFYYPEAIKYILLAGGIYLAYEGVEKCLEYTGFGHPVKEGVIAKKLENNDSLIMTDAMKKEENSKIKLAVLTDFILSIEIAVIALSTVIEKSFIVQVAVVSLIAIGAVVVVYGLVGLLIRLDNIGFWLQDRSEKDEFLYKLGTGCIKSLPPIIKWLGYIGTLAMLLVAGGIFLHNVDIIHHSLESYNVWLFKDLVVGSLVGLITLVVVQSFLKFKSLF